MQKHFEEDQNALSYVALVDVGGNAKVSHMEKLKRFGF